MLVAEFLEFWTEKLGAIVWEYYSQNTKVGKYTFLLFNGIRACDVVTRFKHDRVLCAIVHAEEMLLNI